MKKAIAILAATFVAGTFAVTPALAGTFGDFTTINSTGGTDETDGLKLDIASGQLQATRNGSGQLYSETAVPDPDDADAMSNYFTVAFTSGGTDYTIAPIGGGEVGYGYDFSWESGTSSSNLSDDGKSGTVVNTLTADIDGSDVVLEITYTYTYPDLFVNVSTKLTLPSGWTSRLVSIGTPTRLLEPWTRETSSREPCLTAKLFVAW